MKSLRIQLFECSELFLDSWADAHWKPSTGKFVADDLSISRRYYSYWGNKDGSDTIKLMMREFNQHLALSDIRCFIIRDKTPVVFDGVDPGKVYFVRINSLGIRPVTLSEVREWSDFDGSLKTWWYEKDGKKIPLEA